jgi:uncharacterized protein (DUF111 family)
MRLIIGETPANNTSDMVQLETNIDDMNPQFYGHVMEKLFAAGARDVYLTPIQMKKNRPDFAGRHCLSLMSWLAELILRETTLAACPAISRYGGAEPDKSRRGGN